MKLDVMRHVLFEFMKALDDYAPSGPSLERMVP